jgi:hypothetical protein
MRAGARNRAGAALLRMRQPKQAVEAWMDELKVLEQAGAEEAMAAMKVKEEPKEEEARVWLQCGNSHTLASVDGSNDGDATEAYKKCLDLAKEVKSLELIAAAEKGLKKDLDVASMLRGQ